MDAEPDIRLAARFDIRPDGGLDIHYTVENRSPLDVYLFNGLWNLNAESQFEPDEQGAYRFVGEEEIFTNLVGIPPLPRSMTVLYRNVPHLTQLKAGAELKVTISLAAPLQEYNPYFPETDDSTFQPVTIQKLELQVQYLSKRDDVQVQESKILPGLFELVTPAALEHVKTLTSRAETKLEVQQRTDAFERD